MTTPTRKSFQIWDGIIGSRLRPWLASVVSLAPIIRPQHGAAVAPQIGGAQRHGGHGPGRGAAPGGRRPGTMRIANPRFILLPASPAGEGSLHCGLEAA